MSRHDARCANCEEPADRCGLPIGPHADFVAVTDPGEWGAVPSCRACHNIHAAAKEHGPAVLDAYVLATDELRRELRTARAALRDLASAARTAHERAGDP